MCIESLCERVDKAIDIIQDIRDLLESMVEKNEPTVENEPAN